MAPSLSSHYSEKSGVERVRVCMCVSFGKGLHLTQPWFHGKLSRDEAQRLIAQQGLVDG